MVEIESVGMELVYAMCAVMSYFSSILESLLNILLCCFTHVSKTLSFNFKVEKVLGRPEMKHVFLVVYLPPTCPQNSTSHAIN